MPPTSTNIKEGNLEAPTRHPLAWKSPDFYNEESLFKELERVYEICHGCRRCVSLCQAFPTLFDLIDASPSLEIDGVAKSDYWQVVDHCYLCDLCYMTKCPYVPPHEWNLDFPHLMLRAKAVKFRNGNIKFRDRILTSTDLVGRLASLPLLSNIINIVNNSWFGREILARVLQVHRQARLPKYQSRTMRKRLASKRNVQAQGTPIGRTTGKVALFTTCYGNYCQPGPGEDLVAVLEHNNIPVTITNKEHCCGMPKLELGDLDAVNAAKEANIPVLAKMVDAGWDIMALIPSCVLMFKQELPLMYPDDPLVRKVKEHTFDPFEYLMLRHKEGQFNTEFKHSLGKIAYQASCHQRVQNIGQKTKEILSLIPDTQVEIIERCSGHDGTYAVKQETYEVSMKVLSPVVKKVQKFQPEHYGSDCPMAGGHIAHGLNDGTDAKHPVTLLRKAYGI
ncbi:Fe-S oxidoreductase [Achromatium sp. WMS1]|nr:Fe-S oxidoreductase [Achromatium sp. WMS1]